MSESLPENLVIALNKIKGTLQPREFRRWFGNASRIRSSEDPAMAFQQLQLLQQSIYSMFLVGFGWGLILESVGLTLDDYGRFTGILEPLMESWVRENVSWSDLLDSLIEYIASEIEERTFSK